MTLFPDLDTPAESVRPWLRPDYHASATFDASERHRYTLIRSWGQNPDTLVIVGLNPSTADAMRDDPTIRRCVDFADQIGFGALLMLNAYAWRETDPARMFRERDLFDTDNDRVLLRELAEVPWAVCAWGGDLPAARTEEVLRLFREVGCEPRVFGLTKNGAPRHPLYQPRTARPVPWVRS